MKTSVDALKHTDVRGKELLYLIIGEGDVKIIINVGQKTWNAVNNLQNKKTEPKNEPEKQPK